ncbi:MAG TPA: MmcQ/YjbR family DNA-binding protein [Candidatus Dormibacteraeota bacterium]|nr:MmcQ/YjbR family DNA-binding protein [Candidatus Dormibacteraeota bacterium]
MAGWDDVRRIALGLPGTSERLSRGNPHWRVADRLFVWDRPLHRPDLAALGPSAPTGPIIGARIAHIELRPALIAANPDVFFTIPHFDGYPAILARLDVITLPLLEDLITDAWLVQAPAKLAKQFREGGV